jgi:hypothetical protein
VARFTSLLIHTVTIYNPTSGSTDRRGNEVFSDGTGVSSPARVELTTATEVDDARRDARFTTYRVFLPRDVTVTATSVVEWEGRRHRVVGGPDTLDGRSGPHHVELMMERIEGV